MLRQFGLGDDDKIMFTHLRITGQYLDDGLIPLMSDQDVLTLFKYVPKFEDVYVESDV